MLESVRARLGEFDVALFYSMLRAEGCNPHIRNGWLYVGLCGAVEAGEWAAIHDPGGALRMEYARTAWAERPFGADVVELG